MKREINIGGISCTFKSSAAIPRLYRIKFGRDIFSDLSKLDKKKGKKDEFTIDDLTVFENVAYIMHKNGDPTQPDNIDEWLDQFETFDIYMVLPEIIEMWGIENEQQSTLKKNHPQ